MGRPLGLGLKRALLTRGVSSASKYDQANLMFAALEGDTKKLSELLGKGESVDGVNYSNRTALHVASAEGNLNAVKLLCECKANLNVLDDAQFTALESALQGEHDDVIKYLYSQGARLSEKRSDTHIEAMLLAATKGDTVAIARLIECGLDPNMGDYDGRQPLHLASAEGNVEAVELLLEKGAEVNPIDRFGNTPLADSQRGIGSHLRQTAEVLIKNGGMLTPSTSLNVAKLSVVIEDVMPLMCGKPFELVEAWLPVGDVEASTMPTEFVAHDYWYADPAYYDRLNKFARTKRGKTISAKSMSESFRMAWETEKPAITEVTEQDTPGRWDLCEKAGLRALSLVPIALEVDGKRRVCAIFKFYSLTEKSGLGSTRWHHNQHNLSDFSDYARRTVQAAYYGNTKPARFPDYALTDSAMPQKVFRHICETTQYNHALVYSEVANFFALGINSQYFNSFRAETIARHVTAFIGAKKFSQASKSINNLWMEVQNNQDFMGGTEGNVTTGPEQAILMAQMNHRKMLAAERRLQNMIDRLPMNYSFNFNYYSADSPIPQSDEDMGVFVLRSEEYGESPETVSPDSNDLSKVAGVGFLARNNKETIDRYQMILDMATDTLAPVYRVLEEDEEGIPTLLSFRATGKSASKGESIISAMTELMDQAGLKCVRKACLRFSNGFLVFQTVFERNSDDKKIRQLLDDMTLMHIIPLSELTPNFLQGNMSADDYIYASCAGRFIYYFVNQRSEEYNALVESFQNTPMALARLKNLHTRLKREAVSMSRVWEVMLTYPDILKDLAKDFHERTSEDWIEPKPLSLELEKMIESKSQNALDAQVLQACMQFNSCVLKSNIYKRQKSSLAFRLNLDFLDLSDWPAKPYGIFFMLASNFQGFHLRFKDVSRGGIRLIVSRNRSHFNNNMGSLFSETYNLAHTQNNKNKDIPEFGSKGTILLHPNLDPATEGFAAFKSYISGLMDVLIPDGSYVDNYKKEEILFLGPDEGTANMMEWAATYAKTRGYGYWKALTTGKPPSMGGIPHDTYGMTTRSVHRYVVGALAKLNLDESTVTKCQTGGPDGDLGSNEILISKDKTKVIVDGSGVVYDPKGLNRKELERLATERKMIEDFDATLLGEGAFKVLVSDTNVTLPCGELVESGLTLRNDFHLHPLFEGDLFVPCGGRPESINLNNVKHYIKEDGTPRFKIIVEGANLFFTNDARRHLEEHGVILYKDASSNKGGVTSSSFEVLAALAFPDTEFKQHMCVAEDGKVPDFYQVYVKEIQERLEYNADLEFECVWREHERSGKPRYICTELVSEKINELNDFVAASDTLWNNVALRRKVLKLALPKTLQDHLGMDAVLQNVPENYLRASFATYLASRYVYQHGLDANEFAFFEFMRPLFGEDK